MEEFDVGFVEAAGLDGLDDDDPDHDALNNERCRHQRMKALFTRFREISIARMRLGILDGDRLATFRRHPNKPFPNRELDVAHGIRLQTNRGGEG